MKKVLILSILAVVALTGCHRRGETALTGAYGSTMISGEVFLSGMPDSSPAGVEVSVRGTGMTMLLGADGRFSFSGVPDGAPLDFRRASDGIDASLELDGASGFLSVQLEKARASATAKSGRRRSAGRGGEKVYEFEGVIRTAGAEKIVLFTSRKEEVTIVLAAETIIRKGQTLLTPADLTVDTRVHVKARLASDAYTAVLVIVQNPGGDDGDGEPAPAAREYEGKVVSISAQQLVVFTSKKEEVTFTLTADTVIRKGSATFDFAQILAGMLVHVKATTNADGTRTATLVIVQNTRVETSIEGTVASAGASSLVVTTAAGNRTVQVVSSTQIRRAGKKIALADVAAGAKVKVEGTLLDTTTIQARKITVEG